MLVPTCIQRTIKVHLWLIAAQKGNEIIFKSFIATGETLWHVAIRKTDKEFLSFLSQKAANVNEVDNHNQTPLSLAFSLRHFGLGQLLVDAGADVHAKNSQGNEFLMMKHLSAY
jgi:ankyrin repeat protein